MIVTISIAIQSIIYYINTLEAGKLRQVKWPVCICITKTKPDLDSELNNEHYICQDLCKRSHLVFK